MRPTVAPRKAEMSNSLAKHAIKSFAGFFFFYLNLKKAKLKIQSRSALASKVFFEFSKEKKEAMVKERNTMEYSLCFNNTYKSTHSESPHTLFLFAAQGVHLTIPLRIDKQAKITLKEVS